MSLSLLSFSDKFSRYFPNHSNSCLQNTFLLCNCILIKETLNLHQLKGVAGMLLDKSEVDSNSHYKHLLGIFEFYSLSRFS